MPDRSRLEATTAPLALRAGAKNAVENSLAIGDADAVTLIYDDASGTVAAAFLQEIDTIGAKCFVHRLKHHGLEGGSLVPRAIETSMRKSTVSIYVVWREGDEALHRRKIINIAGECNLRHAHMLDVSEDSMQQGMLSNATQTQKLNDYVIEHMKKARSFRITSNSGTDLSVELDTSEEIHASSGVVKPGSWENLPTGEIYTVPKSVEGVYVCDNAHSIPESVIAHDRYMLRLKPLKLHFTAGRLKDVEGGVGNLSQELKSLIEKESNLDRCGLVGIGTNFQLLMPVGDCIQDLLLPGAYISLGRPSVDTTCTWTSSMQIIFAGRSTSVDLDGVKMVSNGKYDSAVLKTLGITF